ncbi:MAG: peptidoglycan DD-metalloendopeptidase family protein [Gammaproteobacteria bacterium]
MVRQGDTLYSIAWHYGLDYRELAAWNHIAPPYLIYPGEQIQVVGHSLGIGVTATRSTVTSSPQPLARRSYQGPWVWPAVGKVVGHFTGVGVNGSGIGIVGTVGETVVAAHSGRVVYVGSGLPSYGRLIIIRDSPEYLSAYAFNQHIKVAEGMIVKAGQPIAVMGRRDGRALLHFEIRRRGHPINPLALLPRH